MQVYSPRPNQGCSASLMSFRTHKGVRCLTAMVQRSELKAGIGPQETIGSLVTRITPLLRLGFVACELWEYDHELLRTYGDATKSLLVPFASPFFALCVLRPLKAVCPAVMADAMCEIARYRVPITWRESDDYFEAQYFIARDLGVEDRVDGRSIAYIAGEFIQKLASRVQKKQIDSISIRKRKPGSSNGDDYVRRHLIVHSNASAAASRSRIRQFGIPMVFARQC